MTSTMAASERDGTTVDSVRVVRRRASAAGRPSRTLPLNTADRKTGHFSGYQRLGYCKPENAF